MIVKNEGNTTRHYFSNYFIQYTFPPPGDTAFAVELRSIFDDDEDDAIFVEPLKLVSSEAFLRDFKPLAFLEWLVACNYTMLDRIPEIPRAAIIDITAYLMECDAIERIRELKAI